MKLFYDRNCDPSGYDQEEEKKSNSEVIGGEQENCLKIKDIKKNIKTQMKVKKYL